MFIVLLLDRSKDGLTFVVKDTKKFQYDFIPKYFKHNNFSSFVRQLNFYGFRKIRSDPLLIKDADNSEESKYWRFHHEKFQRGHPEWLTEIRKSNHTETADKQEVETLRAEVTSLKRKVANMSRDMEGLKALVGSLFQSNQLQNQALAPEIPSKKLKLSLEAPDFVSSNVGVKQSEPTMASVISLSNPDEKKVLVDVSADPAPPKPDALPLQSSVPDESIGLGSFTSQDEEMLTSLFALDPLDEIDVLETGDRPMLTTSMNPGGIEV